MNYIFFINYYRELIVFQFNKNVHYYLLMCLFASPQVQPVQQVTIPNIPMLYEIQLGFNGRPPT